jgi:hypothetical protein
MTQRIEEATDSPVNERFGADLDRLLQPANHFSHPLEVVGDQTLSLIEKRAILASWASDACAVDSMPALHQMPGSPAPVAFDAVMDALRSLMAAITSGPPGCSDGGEDADVPLAQRIAFRRMSLPRFRIK